MKRINVRGVGQLKTTTVRRVRQIGNALYLCLPKAYCSLNNINANDQVVLVHDIHLRIIPIAKDTCGTTMPFNVGTPEKKGE